MSDGKTLPESVNVGGGPLSNTDFQAPPPLVVSGELSVQDSVATQTLTSQGTYYKIATWSTIQNANNVGASLSDSSLTIQRSGWYLVFATLCYNVGTTLQMLAALFVNGQIHPNGKIKKTNGVVNPANDEIVLCDLNYFNAGDVVDLRVGTANQNNPVTFGLTNGNFGILYMGGSPTP